MEMLLEMEIPFWRFSDIQISTLYLNIILHGEATELPIGVCQLWTQLYVFFICISCNNLF